MATYSDLVTLIENNLSSGGKIPATKHREVEIALLDYIQANLAQSGDIKAIKCDVTYLNANFETNGLGKNLRAGWAICNGNNGTDNLAGRVIVGYGLGYSSFGAVGGNKDAVIPAHTHTVKMSNVTGSNTNTLTATNGGSGGGTSANNGTGTVNTGSTGSTANDLNMQPYVVRLYIMKL